MASRVRLAQVQLKSWVHVILEDVGRDIKRSAGQMGIQTSGVIRLPTKTTRWSVLRSPFVNKSAMDQFERKEHGRLIEFYGASAVGEDATKVVHFMRYLEHTILPAHSAARARITLFSDERVLPKE